MSAFSHSPPAPPSELTCGLRFTKPLLCPCVDDTYRKGVDRHGEEAELPRYVSRSEPYPVMLEALHPMANTTAAPPGAPRTRSLYKGDPGMWSWVAHRITGVATFFFLFVHVLDTALVRVSPDTYDRVIDTYKNPLVNLMEVGLVGAVLYHALNGVRIMLVDFWEKGARYQRPMLWAIVGVWVVVMIPGIYFMLERTVRVLVGGS
jgi:succinate dehydrogenase / fumarate reductase cytochrome b subunit